MQVHGLAHEREPAAGDDRLARGEVVDELVLAEGLKAQVAKGLFLGDAAPHPVDPALEPGLRERLREALVALAGRVHEEVLTAPALRGEDLRAQDGGKETRPLLAERRMEERGDEVLVAPRKLALDERLRELELGLVPGGDLLRQRRPVDDLHVVDRQDRQAVRLRVEVRPRLEVADHRLGPEARDELEVGGDVLRYAHGAGHHVRPERLGGANAVLVVDHVEAVDLVHALEALREKVDGPPRGHDLDVVILGNQMLEDDARPHRMPHALTDHAIEDLHRAGVYLALAAR